MLRFMGLQRVGHDGVTELNSTAEDLSIFMHYHSDQFFLTDSLEWKNLALL